MMDTTAIIFNFVCPTLGVITSCLMSAAPFLDVVKATQSGRLGGLNPTPWAVNLGNTFGWVLYGLMQHNLFVLFSSAPGFFLTVWFNLQAVKLIYADSRCTHERALILHALNKETNVVEYSESSECASDIDGEKEPVDIMAIDRERCNGPETSPALSSSLNFARIVWEVAAQTKQAPVAHEKIIMFMVVMWTIVSSIITLGSSIPHSVRNNIVGAVCNFNLVFFYGAPLSTIFEVLNTKSSATVHVPTMILNTCNGFFWLVFGISIKDYYVGLPNIIGALLGVVQIVLCIVFPRRPIGMNHKALDDVESAENEDDENDESMVKKVVDKINTTTHSSCPVDCDDDKEKKGMVMEIVFSKDTAKQERRTSIDRIRDEMYFSLSDFDTDCLTIEFGR